MCRSWSDQRIESYLRNCLEPEENTDFEKHLLDCPKCQERIDDEVNSLLALRRAAQSERMRVAFAF